MGKSRRRKRLGYLCLGMLVMLIISGCSEKEKISCGKENLEWAYCVKEADDIQSAVPPIVWGEYYIQANMQVEGDFKTYIERYCELKKMDIKVYDFESGECIAKWSGKEKLSPYLEEYQMAEEKLETCIYNKKPCLCVFMEEKKIRKHASEELPQTVFLLEIETGKVLKQMRKEEWTEREDVVDKMEVQLKDLVDPKQLKYEKSAFFLTSDTLGIQVAVSDIPEGSQIYDKFPELKKEKNKKKTIYFYIKENGKWEEQLEQLLPKGEKLQIPEKEESIMEITPLV